MSGRRKRRKDKKARKARQVTTADFQTTPPPDVVVPDGAIGGRPHTRTVRESSKELWSSLAAIQGTSAHQSKAEDAVVRLTNTIRRQAGLPALKVDARLKASARGHSRDMARRGFFAHKNPDGLTPFDRMLDAGYPYPGAENVARGQELPRDVVAAWLASPGHRANLLNAEFATIGVGAYFGPGGPTWTQNFGF